MVKSIEQKIETLEYELLILEKLSHIRESLNQEYKNLIEDIDYFSSEVDCFLSDYNSNNTDYHYVDREYILSIWLNILERYKLVIYFYLLSLNLLNIEYQIDRFEAAQNELLKQDSLDELKECYKKTLKDADYLSYMKNNDSKLSPEICDMWDEQIVDSNNPLKEDFIGSITNYYTDAVQSICTIFGVANIIESYIATGKFNKKNNSEYEQSKEILETFLLDFENKREELFNSVSYQINCLDKYLGLLCYIGANNHDKNK